MARVIPGRFSAQIDEPFVVSLIGIRVNRPLAFRKWVPTAVAMAPMLRELQQSPHKGLLGVEQFFYWPGAALVQYWRSFEDLERFARNPDDLYFPAWRRFNQTVSIDGSVGVWHEPTWSKQATTKQFTMTCQSSTWPKQPSTCRPGTVWRAPDVA